MAPGGLTGYAPLKMRASLGLATARPVLFPELSGADRRRLGEGLLRAPRRGRAAPPLLSVVARNGALAPAAVLAERGWETPELLARAATARQAMAVARVGGAWWQPPARLPHGGHYAVVALDEPLTAPSVAAAMLDRACAERAAARVVVVAPRRLDRRLRPILATAAARGAVVVELPCDPWSLLAHADRVYSAGGELGFLALLAGIPVSAGAAAFYTGWGVTDDDGAVPPHAFRRSLDELVAGACLVATRCRNPYHNRAAAFEEALDIVIDWRRLEAANRTIAACVGMSFWKRRRVAEFVRSTGGVPPFRRTVATALADAERSGGAIAGWASRLPTGLAAETQRRGIPLIRVEDGFIRSKGLGADFLPPASLVFDRRGIYYDPRHDSDLGRILRDCEFNAGLIARAERLVRLLVERGITKYNLASADPAPVIPDGRRRILVPGQVEDDLSIVHGAGTVRSNLMLLAEARRASPDAFIVYKPHPDVLAGHRIGAVPEREVRALADAIVTGGSVPALLAAIDEVHTMTSLLGFEALLRGRRVVVYGRPFYAGWGLTDDRPPCDRGRRLTLAELVAGALILYPRYLDPVTRLPCGPELIIERLAQPALWRAGPVVLARRAQGWITRHFVPRRAASSPPLPRPTGLPVERQR